jgi:tetratricopeptide (TPR) repeat protein
VESRSPLINYFRTFLILLVLLALILIPRPLAGLRDYRKAEQLLEQGGEAVQAASYFAAAARRLPGRPDLYERSGNVYLGDGEYAQADEMYHQAQRHGALSPDGWLAWGRAVDALGDLLRAVGLWEQALDQPGASPDLHFYLAQARQELGDFAGAARDWQAYLSFHPEDGWGHYRLGLLLATKDPAGALPELMQAGRLSPGLEPTVLGLRTALNTALLDDQTSARLLVAGQALAALGEWDLALEAFQNANGADPANALAWAWSGEAKQQTGQDGGAELARALSLAPDSAVVQGLYGLSLQREGKAPQALAAYQKALALEPDSAGWQMALAGAYEQTGDLVSAYGYYLQAVGTAPEDASTWRALAEFCLRNGVHLSDTGLPAAQRLLELDGNNWRSLDTAGQILLATGDRKQAEARLKQAASLDPTQPAPALHLAMLYLQTGPVEMARAYLVQAQTFDPQGPYGWQAGRLLEQYFP